MNSLAFALARRSNALHYARESKRPEGLTSGRSDDLSITELLFVLQMHVNILFQVSTHFLGKFDSGLARLPIDVYNLNTRTSALSATLMFPMSSSFQCIASSSVQTTR